MGGIFGTKVKDGRVLFTLTVDDKSDNPTFMSVSLTPSEARNIALQFFSAAEQADGLAFGLDSMGGIIYSPRKTLK